MLWHAQEQIVGHFRIVIEHRNLAERHRARHAAARNEFDSSLSESCHECTGGFGEGGTGLPNGSTKLIRRPRARLYQ